MPDLAPTYKGFRVYPRGFLGAALGDLIKAPERAYSSQLKMHTYHPDWFKNAKTTREVNRNIESMWRHMNDHHLAIDDIEFREKILKIALNAFGASDFHQWVSIQMSGPSTGDIHMDFLQDTLNFIDTGRRRMNLHTWTTMLSMTEITHNETPDEGQFAWFFKGNRNVKLVDVIQRWCGQPNGFADLAQTLHVLFGEVAK